MSIHLYRRPCMHMQIRYACMPIQMYTHIYIYVCMCNVPYIHTCASRIVLRLKLCGIRRELIITENLAPRTSTPSHNVPLRRGLSPWVGTPCVLCYCAYRLRTQSQFRLRGYMHRLHKRSRVRDRGPGHRIQGQVDSFKVNCMKC